MKGKLQSPPGSDRGIGRGIAIALAKEGCKVVVNSYKEDEDGKNIIFAARIVTKSSTKKIIE